MRFHTHGAPLTACFIGVNAAVALVSLACLLTGWPDVLRAWMPLSIESFRGGGWWEVFTYMWIHAQVDGAGVFHILFNMMTLLPFGRVVESAWGPWRFAAVYLAGGLAGAGAFLIEAQVRGWGTGPEPGPVVVGASAAVLAVVAAFARLHPDARLYLFFLPVKVPARRAVQGFALVSAVLLFVPVLQEVAHGAHLGGMLAGWLGGRWFGAGFRTPPPPSVADDPREWSDEEIRRATDRVLERIAVVGLAGLTDREREILREARQRL